MKHGFVMIQLMENHVGNVGHVFIHIEMALLIVSLLMHLKDIIKERKNYPIKHRITKRKYIIVESLTIDYRYK